MEKPSSVKLMPTRNYDYLTVKSFPEVCRVCLAKRNVLKPLTEVNFTHNLNINGFPECVHFINVVKQFCNITLSSSDRKPQKICDSCTDMAAKAYGFFQLFTYSNMILEKKLAEEMPIHVKENLLPQIYTIDDSDEDCIDTTEDFVFKKPYPVVKDKPTLDNTNQAVGLQDIEVFVIPESEKVVASPKFNPTLRWVQRDHNYSRLNKPKPKIQPSVKYKRPRPPRERKPRIRIKVKKPPKSKPVVDKSILKCNLCKTVEFRTVEEVLEHIDENHFSHLRCIICYHPLKRRSTRKFHISCHFPNKFPCRRCQIIFESREALRTHEASNEHINRKMCHICGKVFKMVYNKNEHIRSVHMKSKDFQCAKCGATFSFRENLRRHERRHDQPKPFLCQECGKAFTTHFTMKVHLQKIHQIDQGISIPQLKESKKYYNQRRSCRLLLSVRKQRKKPDRFECPICSIKFLYYNMYLTHCSSHPEFTEFPCNECEAKYASLEEYLDHEPVHKKFACSVCGMRFKAYNKMYTHKSSHKPPVKCPVCQKDIKDNLCLKMHMLTHTKEKPHVCELCGKSYRQSASLRAHTLGAHGSKPFECHLCDKKFMYNSELRAHIRVHTGERPFVCPYCDKPFRDTTSRHKHVKNDHPEMMQEFIAYKETYQAAEVRRADIEC